LLGICRRAWSQNQVRRQAFAAARAALEQAGIPQVTAIGPVAWSARYWPERAVRPIGSVDLLVAPGSVQTAVGALVRAGYKPAEAERAVDFDAETSGHYFARPVSLLSPKQETIQLHWRPLPNTVFALGRQAPVRIVEEGISREEELVAAAGGMFSDGMDGFCDAAMILRSARALDWDCVAALVRGRPGARRTLARLMAAGYGKIPDSVLGSWTNLLEPLAIPLRMYRRARSSCFASL
jgi:hypothetical protein